MAKEHRFKCKDCDRDVVVSDRVFRLMRERGESLPERCDVHRPSHRQQVREIKAPYFEMEWIPESEFSVFDYYESLHTPHGDRHRREVEVSPDNTGMRIRITDEYIKQLYRLLKQNQVVVLASPTGTGKSVYVLYRLLEAPDEETKTFTDWLIRQGQVVQTQPLTEAVQRTPMTISQRLLGESRVGALCALGLRHRGKELGIDYDPHNLGIIVTDGSLRNWIREGHLGQYSLIMIDEAHKRSVNIDSLLALLRHKLPLYPHLKVIISSATIAVEEFRVSFETEGIRVGVLDLSETLGEEINYVVHFWDGIVDGPCNCWLCTSIGRKFSWQQESEPPDEKRLPVAVSDLVVDILRETDSGGILVFLPGQAVIEDVARLIEEKKHDMDPTGENIPVIPVYRRLGEEEVTRCFNQMGKKRRVLVTTDIAETGHTFGDITYVVDSGLIKESQWDRTTESSSLPIVPHSQAGCKQRWGRTGRIRKGYVYCLYTSEDWEGRAKQTKAEVFRSNLEDYLLTLRASGVVGEVPFVGEVDDQESLQAEVQRADSALKRAGFVDDRGRVTERGIELFRVPLSAFDKALLDVADEANCLVEMATALVMMRTEEGEPRTGAALYNRTNGLLLWDARWAAVTKAAVQAIHQGLKAGCDDDLEFVLKLVACYQQAKKRSLGEEWAERHFVNYKTLQSALSQRDELIDIYRARVFEGEVRELDLGMMDRTRAVLLSLLLPDRLVKMSPQDGVYAYQMVGSGELGVLSPHSVGHWSHDDQAILLMATKGTVLLAGRYTNAPIACFLVRTEMRPINRKELLADQAFPVGSQVTVAQQGEDLILTGTTRAPSPVQMRYGSELTFGDFAEDSARRKREGSVQFPASLLAQFSEQVKTIEAMWHSNGEELDVSGRNVSLIGWQREGGRLRALIAPETRLAAMGDVTGKRPGETLLVTIESVARDPYGTRGWVVAKTKNGFEIPLEMGDLCLDDRGFGLERLVGQRLNLRVIELVRFIPKLSNFSVIVQDLEKIIDEVSEQGTVEMDGYVEDVDSSRSDVYVSVPRDVGVVHVFQLWLNPKAPIRWRGIPEGDLSYLAIGEKVTIELELADNPLPRVRHLHPRKHELDSLPNGKGWRYDDESGRLFFPCKLREGDIARWTAEAKIKDMVIRASWRAVLAAKVIGRDIYQSLKVGDIVVGTVVEYMRTRAGQIAGVRVKIARGNADVLGFVPASRLAEEVPDEGQEMSLVVIQEGVSPLNEPNRPGLVLADVSGHEH